MTTFSPKVDITPLPLTSAEKLSLVCMSSAIRSEEFVEQKSFVKDISTRFVGKYCHDRVPSDEDIAFHLKSLIISGHIGASFNAEGDACRYYPTNLGEEATKELVNRHNAYYAHIAIYGKRDGVVDLAQSILKSHSIVMLVVNQSVPSTYSHNCNIYQMILTSGKMSVEDRICLEIPATNDYGPPEVRDPFPEFCIINAFAMFLVVQGVELIYPVLVDDKIEGRIYDTQEQPAEFYVISESQITQSIEECKAVSNII